MKISYSLFQSRVARRLFILFLFSSLIPIASLGYLSYTNFSKKLLEQSRQHLHQVSKSVGYTIIERLDNLHRELSTIAIRYKNHIASKKPIEQFEIDRKSRINFSAIVVNSQDKKYVPLNSGIDEFPSLSADQLVHIQNGNPVLVTVEFLIHEHEGVRMVREQDMETNFPLFKFYEA